MSPGPDDDVLLRLRGLLMFRIAVLALVVGYLEFGGWYAPVFPVASLPFSWLVANVLWAGMSCSGDGLIRLVLGAQNIAPAPAYSREEALIARGRYLEGTDAAPPDAPS